MTLLTNSEKLILSISSLDLFIPASFRGGKLYGIISGAEITHISGGFKISKKIIDFYFSTLRARHEEVAYPAT